LKANLELLLGGSGKRTNFSDRRRTEIRNRFEEAHLFLKELNFSKGLVLLEKLENKFI